MRRRAVPRRALAGALLVMAQASLVTGSAWALSASEAQSRAQSALSNVEQRALKLASATPKSVPPAVEGRIASGELLLRSGDHDRAIDTLNQVIELYRQGKGSEASYADGLYLLGEGYFGSKQFLSARRQFREILEAGQRAPYSTYAGRSLSRLVDIALRTNDLNSLDYVFERLAKLPTSDSTGSLQYARGKALLAKGDLRAAKASASSVQASSPYALQANYLLGVILTREATPAAALVTSVETEGEPAKAEGPLNRRRYSAAINQFRKVTRMPAATSSDRHVVDLAWMAVGRLFYESDDYLEAADAYSHVDRTSPEFSTMLYELAWVYVRLGDYDRAQRALEVLTITDPQSLELADGSLLRADLMLRAGQFAKALAAYEQVKAEYDPIRDNLHRFLSVTTDPAVYYDKLTADEFTSGGELAPVVLDWAKQESEDDQVFSLIDDVTRSRQLVKRSRRQVVKLNAVLSGPTRVKAFPKLQEALKETVGLINKLSLVRLTLASGLDDVASGDPSTQLAPVRAGRRALTRRMGWLPVTDGDFARRDAAGEKQWAHVSQQLQRLTLEADRLQATVNGLRRVLQDAEGHGVTHDPASRERFKAEIEANERDLEVYRERIEHFREALEMGSVQIGFGDQRYVEDDRVRAQFRETFARELSLVEQGHDSTDARRYVEEIRGILGRVQTTEDRLFAVQSKLEKRAEEAALDLSAKVRAEAASIEAYAQNLDTLDHEARLLVGEVAMRNFAKVRDRLASIVLRADVGIVQEAWELREEQMARVRDLQRERAREEQNLNDELREVIDDAEDGR